MKITKIIFVFLTLGTLQLYPKEPIITTPSITTTQYTSKPTWFNKNLKTKPKTYDLTQPEASTLSKSITHAIDKLSNRLFNPEVYKLVEMQKKHIENYHKLNSTDELTRDLGLEERIRDTNTNLVNKSNLSNMHARKIIQQFNLLPDNVKNAPIPYEERLKQAKLNIEQRTKQEQQQQESRKAEETKKLHAQIKANRERQKKEEELRQRKKNEQNELELTQRKAQATKIQKELEMKIKKHNDLHNAHERENIRARGLQRVNEAINQAFNDEKAKTSFTKTTEPIHTEFKKITMPASQEEHEQFPPADAPTQNRQLSKFELLANDIFKIKQKRQSNPPDLITTPEGDHLKSLSLEDLLKVPYTNLDTSLKKCSINELEQLATNILISFELKKYTHKVNLIADQISMEQIYNRLEKILLSKELEGADSLLIVQFKHVGFNDSYKNKLSEFLPIPDKSE